ncbi:hypothetical protein B0T14DRAFT_523992 [Immersiella caudata]|uniref:Uncharacterized protein n=1 Tax=Immersiella caudata TaxID=314043 RepID=A0AA39WK69_9PEZI|nr:hypothetical protein B0T14DRAFT_523992 [Immersiella caudata]
MKIFKIPKANSRSSLLELPLEIRELIIGEFILAHHGKAPRLNDLDFWERLRRAEIESRSFSCDPWTNLEGPRLNRGRTSSDGRDGLGLDKGFLDNPALPLLLASRQIHRETKDLLALKSFKKLTRYTLDLICLDEAFFYATWLSIPWRASRIDELYIRLRFFPDTTSGSTHEGAIASRAPESSSDKEIAARTFYRLLDQIAKRGIFRDGTGNNQPLIIDRIVADFTTSKHPAPQQHGIKRLGLDRLDELPERWKFLQGGRENQCFHSVTKICCSFMAYATTSAILLGMQSICSSVGEIEYCLDGGPRVKVSLDRWLETILERCEGSGKPVPKLVNVAVTKRSRARLSGAKLHGRVEDGREPDVRINWRDIWDVIVLRW